MKPSDLPEKIAKFVLTCSDDDVKDLTVTSIAREFGADRSYLNRRFKELHDCTLCKFIFSEKMTRAANLLKDEPHILVHEVAERMGFCSVDYFSKVFKRHFGILPSKYLKYKRMSNGH